MRNLYQTLPTNISDEELLQRVAEWIRDATRNRRFDTEDYDEQFASNPKIYEAPASLSTFIGTEKEGDMAIDNDYLYIVYDNAGTLEWKQIPLNLNTDDDVEFASVKAQIFECEGYVLADDTATSFAVGASAYYWMWTNDNSYIRGRYRTTGTFLDTNAGALATAINNTALNGTSGADGDMSISYTGGNIYIENRRGTTITINLALMKGAA